MMNQFIQHSINEYNFKTYNDNISQARFAVIIDEKDSWFGRVVMAKLVTAYHGAPTYNAVLYNKEASMPAKGNLAATYPNHSIKLFDLRTDAVRWANRITKLIPVR